MERYIQIITTIDTQEGAQTLAKSILEAHLAACVQILNNIESFYWWEGKIESSKEWMLFIKTTENLYKTVENFIKDFHPYEVPEIIAISIIDGNKDYLKWITNETKKY